MSALRGAPVLGDTYGGQLLLPQFFILSLLLFSFPLHTRLCPVTVAYFFSTWAKCSPPPWVASCIGGPPLLALAWGPCLIPWDFFSPTGFSFFLVKHKPSIKIRFFPVSPPLV